jgi:hypothetical protein
MVELSAKLEYVFYTCPKKNHLVLTDTPPREENYFPRSGQHSNTSHIFPSVEGWLVKQPGVVYAYTMQGKAIDSSTKQQNLTALDTVGAKVTIT